MVEMETAMQKQFDLSRTLNNRINNVQSHSQILATQLKKIKQENTDSSLQLMANNCRQRISPVKLNNYRTLKGHFDKISCCSWYPDNKHLVSSSQDGYLLVWDSTTGLKNNLVELEDPYVMGCDVSSNGELVAAGGLDNTCTVYKVGTKFNEQSYGNSLMSILKGHKEYISDIGFLKGSSSQLVTCSGDKSSILWDTTKGGHVRYFYGHLGDVLSLSVNPNENSNPNVFVTCSCDRLAMMWDVREPLATRKFLVSTNYDPNVLQFGPDGYTFSVGCDDGNVKIYDLRSDGELGSYGVDKLRGYLNDNPQLKRNIPQGLIENYNSENSESNSQIASYKQSIQTSIENSGVISMDFSKSGRLMFTSYAENTCVFIWDIITGEIVGTLKGHNDVVSKIRVSNDGLGVSTASRDETIKIWSI